MNCKYIHLISAVHLSGWRSHGQHSIGCVDYHQDILFFSGESVDIYDEIPVIELPLNS